MTTHDEWKLLCVEDGSFLSLLVTTPSAMRFTPLKRDILDDFYERFGSLVNRNAFLRVAMAADFRQQVLVGVDERVCKTSGPSPNDCAVAGVMASIIQPFLVRPVDRIFLGLRPKEGTMGVWVDGGVRSGTPASHAVMLTRRRVLALNTHRSEGMAMPASKGLPSAFSLLLKSVGSLADQARQWEMSRAALSLAQQQARSCLLDKLSDNRSFPVARLSFPRLPSAVT